MRFASANVREFTLPTGRKGAGASWVGGADSAGSKPNGDEEGGAKDTSGSGHGSGGGSGGESSGGRVSRGWFSGGWFGGGGGGSSVGGGGYDGVGVCDLLTYGVEKSAAGWGDWVVHLGCDAILNQVTRNPKAQALTLNPRPSSLSPKPLKPEP